MGREPAEPRTRSATSRTTEAPPSRLARALRRLAARLRALAPANAPLRAIIRSSAEHGIPHPQIVSLIAEEMFRRAIRAGAFASDHRALFGPWLYVADAADLVRDELARMSRR
jgi:hypothetical protein